MYNNMMNAEIWDILGQPMVILDMAGGSIEELVIDIILIKVFTCFVHLSPPTETLHRRREHSVNLASARTEMNVSKSFGMRPIML